MLRGRHRGLPVAIDRAVMLPAEYKKTADIQDDQRSAARPPSSQLPRDPTPVGDAWSEKMPSEDTPAHRRRMATRRASEEFSLDGGRRASYVADSVMSS